MGLVSVVRAMMIATFLSAAAPAPHDEAPRTSVRESSFDESQKLELLAILDARPETVLTLEAARASAEDDLQDPPGPQATDDALGASLAAEIVAFGEQLVDVETRTGRQLILLLGSQAERTRVDF